MESAPLIQTTTTGEGSRTPLSAAGVFWYVLANLGYGAFYAFNNFVIPLWLDTYTHNAVIKSLMAGSHSFEGVFIQPLVGSISDRLAGPGGWRRPFMRVSIALSTLFLLLAPAAAVLPPGIRLVGIVTCIFLFTLTFNVAIDPYQALLADVTTPKQRGRITGIWYFVGAFGQVLLLVVIYVLNLKLFTGFILVGLLMLITTLLTCAKTREPQIITPHESPRGHLDDIKLALAGLRSLRQARIYMGVFFFAGAGIAAVTPNLSSFIKRITLCSDGTALIMSALLLVCAGLGGLLFGPLVNRFGSKRLLLLSLGMIAVAALCALKIHTLAQVGVVLGLAGIGIGAQNASAYPLLTRLVPAKEIGFYVGLQTASMSLAGPLAAWLTGVMINHSGYRVIFAVCAICLIVAVTTLLFLREERAPEEIALREREIAA